MHYDLTPEPGFHPEIGLLLGTIRDSTREWVENVGEIPDEWTSWSATPGGRSVGALMLHLVECEIYWLETVVGGKPFPSEELAAFKCDQIDQYEGTFPILEPRPFDWYLNLLETWRARAWESLRGVDPGEIRSRGGDDQFTVRWIVAHVLEHDSYHGGQISLMVHQLRGFN